MRLTSNRQAYVVHTKPAAEPILLEDLKDYIRDVPEDGAEDNKLTQFITAARQRSEEFTRKSFITQTWTLWMDDFPSRERKDAWWDGVRELPISELRTQSSEIWLSKKPLQSVSKINTYDDADVATEFPAASYFVDAPGGRIVLRDGNVWPVVDRSANGVEIEFVAGYGVSGAFVPQPIIMAMYMTMAHWYENPMAAKVGEIPSEAEMLLTQFQEVSVDITNG